MIQVLIFIIFFANSLICKAVDLNPLSGLADSDIVKITLESLYSGYEDDEKDRLELYVRVGVDKKKAS